MVKVQVVRHGPSSRIPDHYKVLGVSANATFGEIQRAYWRLAFGGLGAGERVALNEAYDVLGNDRRRREYNALRVDAGLDSVKEAPVAEPAQPAPRADAGLRAKLGWPSI